jgi:signal transduction histidine kinase
VTIERPTVGAGLVRIGRFLAIVVTGIAAATLVARIADPRATGRLADLLAMNPMTAICLLLSGVAVALLAGRRFASFGRGAAIASGILAALGLAAKLPSLSAPLVDRLLELGLDRPGWKPMAQGSAVALILIALGLAVMDSRQLRARTWGQVLLVLGLAPAFLSLGLLVFEAPTSDLPAFQPMAIATALAVFLLGSAALLVRPTGGVMEVATGASPGSVTFRLMLPVVVLVPLALGCLSLVSEARHLYGLAQSAALVATITTLLLVVGLWLVARRLGRADAEHRRVERALEESRLRLDLVLRSVGVGVWDWDVATNALTFDETVKHLWGTKREGPVRMEEVLEHVHPGDRKRAIGRVRRALREAGEYVTSYRVLHPDGSTRVLGARGYVSHDVEGRPSRLTGIHWDMTLQHDAEQARAQAQLQQLELRDQFISHVSHELRSPLTVIFSFLEILLDGLAGPLNEQQREFLEISQRNSSQLRQMIDDLLEVTRAQTGKLAIHPSRMTVAREIEATLEGLRPQSQARQLTITASLPHDLPAALADPYRVRQLVVNLLDNAIKFTPEGGRIEVSAQRGAEGLLISVTDSGPGIPPGEREEIFRQLYQLDLAAPTPRKGLGLGLFICRQLVTKMGGRIWVESAPGHGSSFCFTLPLYAPAAAIVPLLTDENVARGEFALVAVGFEPSATRSWTEKDDAVLVEALEIVRSCTLPDRDQVLPRLGVQEDRESITVLACGGAEAVAALARRIEGQLARSPALQSGRLAWKIRSLVLDSVRDDAADAARTAERLAAEIEAALDDVEPWRSAA